MSWHALTVTLGWLAVAVGFIGTAAQLRRVSREGVEGVSLATWSLFTFMGCFWIAYGAAARSWPVISGSLLLLPMQVAILVRLKPWLARRTVAGALLVFVVSCVIPALTWGWAGGVYGTGIAMSITRVPQFLELIRHRDASGVSTASWSLGVASSLLWVTYYEGVHLWAALTATSFAGVANLTIASLAAWRHRQMREDFVREEVFAIS